MRITVTFLFFLIFGILKGQQVRLKEVTQIDSFPPNVQSVVRTNYSGKTGMVNGVWDTTWTPSLIITKRYDKCRDCVLAVYDNLSGGTKRTDSIIFDAKTGKQRLTVTGGSSPMITETVFDTSGKMISSWTINTNYPTDTSFYTYEYDSLGRLKLEYYRTAKDLYRTTYTYTGSDKVRKKVYDHFETETKGWLLKSDSTFYYDTLGRMNAIMFNSYMKSGKAIFRDSMTTIFNDRGLIVATGWGLVGSQNYRGYQYEYDESGNMIKKTIVWAMAYKYDNSVYIYTYDSQGYISSEVINRPDGLAIVNWKTTYNSKGLPVECIYTYPGSIHRYTWSYTYR